MALGLLCCFSEGEGFGDGDGEENISESIDSGSKGLLLLLHNLAGFFSF